MSDRAYISNIHAVWTIAAQEEALAKVVPGWPKVAVYKNSRTCTPRSCGKKCDAGDRRG